MPVPLPPVRGSVHTSVVTETSSELEDAFAAGLKATLSTHATCSRRGVPMGSPLVASHSRSVLSSLPEQLLW